MTRVGDDTSEVVVDEVTSTTTEVLDALRPWCRSFPPRHHLLTEEALDEVVRSPATVLLVARDAEDGTILGSLTLVVFSAPTGPRAWIEDVVVATHTRGRGVGAALVEEANARARCGGVATVDLTSRPSREAANRLVPPARFVRQRRYEDPH